MANKITLELSSAQVEKLAERLPMKEKIKLVRKLEKETLRERWKGILKDIDKKLKRFPISKDEIAEEINNYRKEKYAKSSN